MANLTVTYVLWLFGGIFGLHHLYLNRPRQCFIWFVSWGGMVMGWLSEVTSLKQYVDEANLTREYKKRIAGMQKASPKPGYNLALLAAQFMIGHQLACLIISAVPEYYIYETYYGPYLGHVLASLGASIGVHLVANMGPQQAPFLKPFLGSACTFPLSYFLYNRRFSVILLCVIVASFFSAEYAEWSQKKKKPSNWSGQLKTWLALSLALVAYGSLWTSNMYFNTRVTTLNGTRVPLRVAAANFIKTQPWDEAREAMDDLIPCVRMYSLEFCQNQFLSTLTELSDPEKYAWAFSVLGFERYPSQKQINAHCRKLSSKFHPDRFTNSDEEGKLDAEIRFIDIQKACGLLNKIKVRRERKSTWSFSATQQSETVNTYSDEVDTENEYNEGGEDDRDVDDEADHVDDDTYTDNDDIHTHNEDCHTKDEHCNEGTDDESVDEH